MNFLFFLFPLLLFLVVVMVVVVGVLLGMEVSLCLLGAQSAVLSRTLAPVAHFGFLHFSLYITFIVQC